MVARDIKVVLPFPADNASFFKCLTRVAIIIGTLVALFVLMQVTVYVNWVGVFSGPKSTASTYTSEK